MYPHVAKLHQGTSYYQLQFIMTPVEETSWRSKPTSQRWLKGSLPELLGDMSRLSERAWGHFARLLLKQHAKDHRQAQPFDLCYI